VFAAASAAATDNLRQQQAAAMNMAEASPPPPREGASSEPLSPELWAIIARRALAAEDSSVQAWARLSLVSPAFRSAVAGA